MSPCQKADLRHARHVCSLFRPSGRACCADAERQLASSASPPLQVRAHQQRPHSSHSAGVTPARQPRQPPHTQPTRAKACPADVPDQPPEAGLRTDSSSAPGKALSPRLDITASSATGQPLASASPSAADISAEVEKLQVCPSGRCSSCMRTAMLSVQKDLSHLPTRCLFLKSNAGVLCQGKSSLFCRANPAGSKDALQTARA